MPTAVPRPRWASNLPAVSPTRPLAGRARQDRFGRCAIEACATARSLSPPVKTLHRRAISAADRCPRLRLSTTRPHPLLRPDRAVGYRRGRCTGANADSPHNAGGPLCTAALQVDALIPNFLIQETNHFWLSIYDQYANTTGGRRWVSPSATDPASASKSRKPISPCPTNPWPIASIATPMAHGRGGN